MDDGAIGQRIARAYVPPRLALVGSVRDVTALSGSPTPTIPPETHTVTTTSTASSATHTAAPVGATLAAPLAQTGGAARNVTRPKLPKTGLGGMAGGPPASRRLGTPLTTLAIAVGLAASADGWGSRRRSRRECWRVIPLADAGDQVARRD